MHKGGRKKDGGIGNMGFSNDPDYVNGTPDTNDS